MHISRCVKLDYGHVGCASDVLELADSRCSGRRRCEIRVPDALFAQTLPCPDDLKPYMEVAYKCVKVQTAPTLQCAARKSIRTSFMEGYLANLVTEATGCGGTLSPWVIEVNSGQTIHVTLYDFAIYRRRQGVYAYAHCQMYALIRERIGGGIRNMTVCGGGTRQKVLYTSTTNTIQVTLVKNNDPTTLPYFVLKYQAVGCPDIQAPPNAWLVRSSEGILIRCNYTRDVFHLKCHGNNWLGQLGNCSKAVQNNMDKLEYEEMGIPYGLSILIVLAIALVIGLFVLFVGLLFLKRQRGFCMRRFNVNGQRAAPGGVDGPEKDYVRHTWVSHDRDQSSVASLGPKSVTWRGESTYAPPSYTGSELPPCTPLVDRGHKPPVYGQLPQARLACGCNTLYDTAGDSDYSTRQALLQGGGESDYPTRQALLQQVELRQLRQDKLIIKPGECAQYFVVEPKGSPSSRGTGASSGVLSQSESPYRCPRDNKENTGSSTPAAKRQQQMSEQTSKAVPQPCSVPLRTSSIVDTQTDDIKLKLRVGENPYGVRKTSSAGENQNPYGPRPNPTESPYAARTAPTENTRGTTRTMPVEDPYGVAANRAPTMDNNGGMGLPNANSDVTSVTCSSRVTRDETKKGNDDKDNRAPPGSEGDS